MKYMIKSNILDIHIQWRLKLLDHRESKYGFLPPGGQTEVDRPLQFRAYMLASLCQIDKGMACQATPTEGGARKF